MLSWAAVTTLHLIGGGPGGLVAMRRHIKSSVAAVSLRRPLVAYVGAASSDNVGFRKMLGAAFVGTGARLEPVRLVSKRSKLSAASQLLEDCDLVFLSGGDVELGMKVLDERGVSDQLRGLARRGKPFLGISAGSIMACRHWVRFPEDGDDDRAEPFACLGIAPIHMDAHSEDDNWSELRVLVRLLARRGDPDASGYGVPKKGCLRLDLDGRDAQITALGAPCARITARRGEPVDVPALEP
jgi:cyanophycinase-like exopeptidase